MAIKCQSNSTIKLHTSPVGNERTDRPTNGRMNEWTSGRLGRGYEHWHPAAATLGLQRPDTRQADMKNYHGQWNNTNHVPERARKTPAILEKNDIDFIIHTQRI